MANVNNAGLGLDFGITGLESIERTMQMLEKIRKSISTLKSMDSVRVNVSVQNSEAVNHLSQKLSQIRNPKSKIDVDVNDNKVNQLKSSINSLHGSIGSLATPIGNFKTKFNESSENAKRNTDENISRFAKFKRQINDSVSPIHNFGQHFRNESDKTSGRIDHMRSGLITMGKIAGGTLVAGAISKAFGFITDKIKEATKAGIEYNEQQQKMGATWNTLTGNAQKSAAMVKTINKYAVKTGQDTELVNETEQGYYHLHSNRNEANSMTRAMLNMSDAVGLKAPQTQAVTQDMVNSLSKGTVNNGAINQISQYFPMLRENLEKYEGKLQHTGKISGETLSKMAKQGKISSETLEKVFTNLGNVKYSKAADNMLKTITGMKRTIKARVPALVNDFVTPFQKAKNPVYSAVSKWVSDKRTDKEFTQMGKAASKGLNTIVTAFSKVYHTGNSRNFMDNMTKDITKGITKISNAIAKNAPLIKRFFSQTKTTGADSIKLMATTMGLLAKITVPFLKFAAAHVNTFARLFALGFAAKKVTDLAIGIKKVNEVFKITRISAMLLGTSFTESGKMISLFSKESIIAQGSMKAWTAVTKVAKAAQVAFNFVMDANPFGAIVLGITAAIAVFTLLYKKFKPFRDLVNSLGKLFGEFFGKIAKGIGKLASKVGKFFSGMWHNSGKFLGNMTHDIGYNSKKWSKDAINNTKKMASNVWDSTKRMGKKVISTFKSMGKDTQRDQKDNNRVMKSYVKIFGDVFTGHFGKLKKDIPKLFSNMWKAVKDIGKTAFDFLNKLTDGKLGKMAGIFKTSFKDISKIWHDSWNSIGKFFSGIWDWIKKIVGKGINNVIGVINDGISGIDWVISKFGGSSTAIGKVKAVHYATGTGVVHGNRRPITKPTMAMLNDGNDSPETGNREMVLHANGESEIVKGRNTIKMLEPNAEVLTASETRELMSGLPRFKKGTGIFEAIKNGASNAWDTTKDAASDVASWTSGVYNSIKDKLKLIEKLIHNPLGFLKSEFKRPSGVKGMIERGLDTGFFNKTVDGVTNWWNELVSMISSTLDDSGGSASGLLAAVEKYGHGHRYVLGAHGPDTFDCSGLVEYALKKAFNIDLPAPSGNQIRNTERISYSQAKPGDLIGNDGHIGVYAGHGKYYSAESPDNHPNIGMGDVRYFPHGKAYFGRVRGLSQKIKEKSPHKHTNDGAMKRLIKSETGGMLGWIKKHLSPLLDDNGGGDGNSPKGHMSKSQFNSIARHAAEIMHTTLSGSDLAKLYWQAFDESTVDPSTGGGINDNDGTGLPYGLYQYKKSTWDSYALKGHKNMFSALDQDLTVLNDRNWRNDIAPAGVGHRSGWSPSGGRKMSVGGRLKKGEIAQVHENGFELFRADHDGQVLPHADAQRVVNNSNRGGNITVNSPITIKGNPDKHTVDLIDQRLEKRNNELVEKWNRRSGRDREGGLII